MLEPKINNSTPNLQNNLKEADFPIHTMKSDLEKLEKNKNYNPGSFLEDTKVKEKDEIKKSLSEKQQTSPFLQDKFIERKNPENHPENAEKKPPIDKIPVNIIAKKEEVPEKKEDESGSGVALAISLSATLIIAIGFGIYYFYSSKKPTERVSIPPAQEIIQEPIASLEKSPAQPEITELSLEKPNFLIINNAETVLEAIDRYIAQMEDLNIGSLIEFVPVNEDLVSLNSVDFASKWKLNFPTDFAENINTDAPFSLFIHKTPEGMRLGLLIPEKIADKSIIAMSSWENKDINTDLKSLFLNEAFIPNQQPFLDNIHQSINIRYRNFRETGTLAIDYAVLQGNVLIASSKNTVLTIIDKLIKIDE